jgi:hypothetical protein
LNGIQEVRGSTPLGSTKLTAHPSDVCECIFQDSEKLWRLTKSNPSSHRPVYTTQAVVNVHSSVSVDFLAPMARSSRSVVARSPPMLFSNCAIDLNPRVARGSCSICRSVRFLFHSLIALKTMFHPLTVTRFSQLSSAIAELASRDIS